MNEDVLILWVQGLSGFIGALILAILGGGYWLRGKFSGINKRIDNLQDSIGGLGDSIATQIQLTGVIIGGLRRNKIMDNSELTKIEQIYMESNINIIRRTIDKERARKNPLTKEELNQLDSYICKAQQGEQFTYSDIQRYNMLVQKLREERGSIDPGVMALMGLGALLLGIWIGSHNGIKGDNH